MKAALYRAPGGPEALTLEEVPDPDPGEGEAVVRVKACGVNRIDVWARSGRYKTSLPHILGTDVAGEVVSVSGGGGVKEGDPVVVYPVLSDGACTFCLAGMPNRCLSRGLIGVASDGGYAELLKAPSSNLIPLDGLDFKVAASLPVNFGTAWRGLATVAKVGPEDTVLVWGAAGGLGHAAVQVAKHLGARVIAVVGDESKASFVEAQGADLAISHRAGDLAERVRGFTGGLGASVVFDHVGGDTWEKSIECLARGGRMVTLGLTSGPKSVVDVRRVYSDELAILGTYGQTKEELQQVLGLASAGRLRPAVDRELPLASAKEAHEIIEARDVRGKILLVP